MTPEECERFESAAERELMLNVLLMKGVRAALQNLTEVDRHSETFVVSFMSRCDFVLCFWFDPIADRVRGLKLKGPGLATWADLEKTVNAFPVASAAEARRWLKLFSGETAPRATLRPLLVSDRGAHVNSEAAEQLALAEVRETVITAALAKEVTLESPRDDAIIAEAASRLDMVWAVWMNEENRLLFMAISGLDRLDGGMDDGKEFLTSDAFLVKDKATAQLWQRMYGDAKGRCAT
jgi:hypothetical protein